MVLSDDILGLVRKIAEDAEYFSEIIYKIHEDLRFESSPFLSVFHPNFELQITNYNLNLYKFLLQTGKFVEILTDEKYSKKYIEGKESFKTKWSGYSPLSFKTWNTLLPLFKTRRDQEFLNQQESFSTEEILKSFENCGFLDGYLEYEDNNSLAVFNFLSLQNSSHRNFSQFKIPISSYYTYNLPSSNSSEVTIDVKVEFIILNETKQLDQYKPTSTNIELAKIVANIINKKFKNYSIKNPCTPDNIRNILTADSLFPDYTSRKSAYKKRNIKKAIDQLYEMGVKLEQCQFLPQIKIMEPSLFE